MAKKALKKITQYVAPDDLDRRYVEIRHESDTSLALVAASLVDNALAGSLHRNLPQFEEAGGASELFSPHGPYGTFSQKIRAGFAMGLFDKIAFSDLNTIREVRNAFAHSSEPLSFAHDAISSACLGLKTLGRVWVKSAIDNSIGRSPPKEKARLTFYFACSQLTEALKRPSGPNLVTLGFRWHPRIDDPSIAQE